MSRLLRAGAYGPRAAGGFGGPALAKDAVAGVALGSTAAAGA